MTGHRLRHSPAERLAGMLRRPDRVALPAAGFVAWLYLSVVALLGMWLTIIVLTTGWRPVVITGSSMQPTLRVGDVLLIQDHPDELLGQRSVITYRPARGDGLVTHRIETVLPESRTYVTRGDANGDADTDPVAPSQVVGVGRLVVPLLGLPVVWAGTGDLVALVAVGALSASAVVIAVSNAVQSRGGGPTQIGRTSEMANRGIRRVRFLAGLIIAGSFYFDAGSFQVAEWGISRNQLMLVSFAVLASVNALSAMASARRGGEPADWVILTELGADTLLAGVLTALSGGSGIAWAFIALPIVEAAVRFRLAGALVHWVVMTLLTVGARLYALERTGAPISSTIDELEQLLDQLGVLLLVVIPGAYLTEQLVTDVFLQDRATSDAVERASLLERVTETGYELNRPGSELFSTLAGAAAGLGFDLVDTQLRLPDGEWKLLAEAHRDDGPPLPEPGRPGSGLQPPDLEMAEVLVDHDDPELAEVLALEAGDLALLARLTVSNEQDRHIVLRAAMRTGSPLQPSAIEALRLLTGQAAVALQNKQLVTELRDVQVELAHQALHDALTGLPNRAQFTERLQTGLAEATDPARRHAVMFMDLDGFKEINDTLGHKAGDALLIHVAQRLTSAIADRGLVARLGGDEFTVLLDPVTDADEAVAVAGELYRALGRPFEVSGTTVGVGASIGVSLAEIGLGGDEILRRADVATISRSNCPARTRSRSKSAWMTSSTASTPCWCRPRPDCFRRRPRNGRFGTDCTGRDCSSLHRGNATRRQSCTYLPAAC